MGRQMKDSGVEWIGEIPDSWNLAELKHFVDVHNGKEVSSEVDYGTENAYPVYGSGGIFKYTNEYQYDGTAVMFGRKGTLGKPLYVQGKFWAVDTMYFLTHKIGLVPRYNYYQLSCFDWEPYITHTALPSVVASQIVSCLFPFPQIRVQEIIADFLDQQCAHIDVVIEKTKASIEEYKKLKQAVITQAVTKGIRGDRPMKDSGIEWIGEIPAEWNVTKITRILDYSHPYPFGDGDHGLIKTEDYLDEGVPFIRVQNIGWGTELILDNMVFISEENNSRIESSTLRPGDILFAKTGATIGKTAIVPDSLPKANTTSHVGKITVDRKNEARFIFYLLSSYIGYRQFWDIACMKTTRPELAIEEMKNIRVLLPKIDEQKQIVRFLDDKCLEFDRVMQKKEEYLALLEKMKKSLIYEYVTGKKEVPAYAGNTNQ